MKKALYIVFIIMLSSCYSKEDDQIINDSISENQIKSYDDFSAVEIQDVTNDTEIDPNKSYNSIEEDQSDASSIPTEEEIQYVRELIEKHDYLNDDYPSIDDWGLIDKVFSYLPNGEYRFDPIPPEGNLQVKDRYVKFYRFPNSLKTNEMTVTNKNTGEEIFHSFNVSKIYRVRERNNLIYFFVDDKDDKLGLYELWAIDGELGIIKKIIDAGLDATLSRDGKLIVYEDYDYAVQLSDEYIEKDIPCIPKIYIFSTESNEIIYTKDLAELQDWKTTYYSFKFKFESNNNVCIELFEERDIVAEVRIDLENDKIEIENFFENYH
ncbi:MAG: hypothetical protein PQJ50_01545 [Spirochaetales bacterium]|nr:hypothetical protein [Spirochaetales bacterium]